MARRVVLQENEEVVAAAVVEVHADAKCLQVPMMAVARGCRQQGFGSMLFAIIGEVAEDLVR